MVATSISSVPSISTPRFLSADKFIGLAGRRVDYVAREYICCNLNEVFVEDEPTPIRWPTATISHCQLVDKRNQ